MIFLMNVLLREGQIEQTNIQMCSSENLHEDWEVSRISEIPTAWCAILIMKSLYHISLVNQMSMETFISTYS